MDESHFKALKELARDGKISQRELAQRVGLSLGRINYIVHSLMKKGYVKAKRFRNSRNKLAYRYVITPAGLKQKAEAVKAFINLKTQEYERLLQEIKDLEEEAAELHGKEKQNL